MFGINYDEKIVDFENFDIAQLGDALKFGGTMLLIGMLTVFAVLACLWLCLTVFKFVFHDLGAKKKAKAAKAAEPVAPVIIEKKNDDAEIVAVIAAAIAAAESESDGVKFKVVSFKRK